MTDLESVIVMFDTSCPPGDDPRLKEYSMLFPNKLNTQEFLFCAMKKYCSVHLSWNTRCSPLIFLWAKTDSYSSVSSKSARSRHYYLAKSARPRHYYLVSDRLITNGMNDRQICIANHIHKNLTLFITFVFRRWSGKQRRREWLIMGRGGLWHAAGRFV